MRFYKSKHKPFGTERRRLKSHMSSAYGILPNIRHFWHTADNSNIYFSSHTEVFTDSALFAAFPERWCAQKRAGGGGVKEKICSLKPLPRPLISSISTQLNYTSWNTVSLQHVHRVHVYSVHMSGHARPLQHCWDAHTQSKAGSSWSSSSYRVWAPKMLTLQQRSQTTPKVGSRKLAYNQHPQAMNMFICTKSSDNCI